MIIKRKNGYYVLSEKTRRNLGGSYKTRKEARKLISNLEIPDNELDRSTNNIRPE